MQLNVNDRIVAAPTADDIVRALEVEEFPEDWYIVLDTGTGALLDGQWRLGHIFTLNHVDNDRERSAEVDAPALKSILLKFLDGAKDWDRACQWEGGPAEPAGASPKKTAFVPAKAGTLTGVKGGEPPTWALIVMVGIIGFIVLMFSLGQWDRGSFLRLILPFANSDYFYVGLIALPMVALLALATVSKLWELRKAQSWSQTTARIVRSEMDEQRHRFTGDAETIRNVPAIEYEFTVNGRKVRGRRVGIGDDAGGANTEATLARYPKGAIVTVYYDPNAPTHCVLERGGPFAAHALPATETAPMAAAATAPPSVAAPSVAAPGVAAKPSAKGCLGGLALLALFGGAIWWLIARGPAFIAAQFPKAEGPFAIFAACFGLAALAIFFALRRYSKQAQNWPSVRGQIVNSAVESYRETTDGRTRTSYRPAVEFAYMVRGREYRSNQIKLTLETGGSQAYAAKVVAKYPQGSDIEVHYDPAAPGTAALENPTGMSWLVLALALACFALAVWQLGIFR
jgi:hypothetical protein